MRPKHWGKEEDAKLIEHWEGSYLKELAVFIGCSEKRAHFEGMTMADYMRWLWNNPQSGQNLYKMFEGIVTPNGKDENGNMIYYYTPKI